MKKRVGICKNYGWCTSADNKSPITGSTDTCPNCGNTLQFNEVSSSAFSLQQTKIIIFLLVIIAAIFLGGLWFTFSASEIVCVLPKVIDNTQIQTPADIKLTEKVNNLAEKRYIKKAIELYYGKWEDQLTINLANARKLKVTKDNYAWLDEMVSKAALALGIDAPATYVVFAEEPNAYVTGVTKPILVIHSGLIDIMEPEELLFIIGHELGHIKFKHVLAFEVVNISYYVVNFVPTETLRAIIANGILFTFLKWSRESEISADRLGMILVGSEETASKALIKLISGLDDKYGEININAFREQSKLENNAFDLRQIPVLLKQVTSTHPFVGSRVEALYQYKESSEYARLFSTGDSHSIKIGLPSF